MTALLDSHAPRRRGRSPLSALRLVAFAVAGSVLVGGFASAPAAEALPAECQPNVIGWQTKGSFEYLDKDGNSHIAETGISPVFDRGGSTCDVIFTPTDHEGASGGGVPAPPATPPAPPGPTLPAPPPSVPPGAGPKCVPGASNDPTPGTTSDTQTGTGQFVVDNIEEGLRSGDLKLDSTSPSRIISMDVNLGEPTSGRPGSNPFEGYSPEDAAQAMYWEGADAPVLTDVGGVSKLALSLAKMAFRAAQRDGVARQTFMAGMRQATPETREAVNQIVHTIVEVQGNVWAAQYGAQVPEKLKWILEGVLELLELAAEVPGPILGAPAPDLAPVYAAASRAGDGTAGSTGPGGSACGQIASATVATRAGLTAGPNWVTITLTGTEHGTLVDRLKGLDPVSLTCPPVSIDTIAAQNNIANITGGCAGTVTSTRLLNRDEIASLPAATRRSLTESTTDSFPSDVEALGLLASFADSDSTSWAAEGHVGFSGDSANGDLAYQAPLEAAGTSDALVAAATDADGVEHPFLIKVAVKAPPRCTADGSIYGLDPYGSHGDIQGGTLVLNRDQPFVIDPKMLCGTDFRDSYRVDLAGTIAGTTRTVDADGSLAYTWTDHDEVGDAGTLTLTGWDDTTGAPTEPVTIKVFVRDLAPVCQNVHADYDRTAMKGKPLTIDLACAMPSGRGFVTPIAPQLAAGDGMSYPAPGGTFRVDGTKVTFTPNPSASGDIVSEGATVWSSDRAGAARPRRSDRFTITVSVTD